MSDLDILKELINDDIIGEDVLEVLLMRKLNKIKQVHPYQITEPKDPKGRWMTYLRIDDKRVKITAITRKSLVDRLFEHYFGVSSRTLKEIYPSWLKKREQEQVSIRTIQRNKNFWNKYYADHKITDMNISKITVDDIEDFLYSSIETYQITVKELNNMKFLLRDMFKMCKRLGYIDNNPFNDINIKTHCCRPEKTQNERSRIYLPVEKEKLFIQLNQDLVLNPTCTDSYAIFLLFKLGLRIGEVVAIKEEDIDLKNSLIHIHRMETLGLNDNGLVRPCVVDHTKKKSKTGDRYLPLSEYDKKIIRSVQKVNMINGYFDNGFLFLDEEGRTKIREIDNRIRKLCNKASIPEKSAHDIRRTVASEMHGNGVPIEIIRKFLGHSDVKTTWGYIYDPNSEERTASIIKAALKSMDGMKIS